VTFLQRAWWIGLLVLAACGGIAEAVPDAGLPGTDAGTRGSSAGVDAGGGDATLDAASQDAAAETGLHDATAQQDASEAASPCASGTNLCGDSCVDLSNDNSNCGSCGNVCQLIGAWCASGECQCECSRNMVSCYPVCCTDPNVDPNNCGTCGNACPEGWACCGGQCIDRNTDPAHCGASCDETDQNLGVACEAGTTCVSGSCTPLDAATD
jgi:hypothetical protein